MVKSIDFKFVVHVPKVSHYKISKRGTWPEPRDPLKYTWQIYPLSERLLVTIVSQTSAVTFVIRDLQTLSVMAHFSVTADGIPAAQLKAHTINQPRITGLTS